MAAGQHRPGAASPAPCLAMIEAGEHVLVEEPLATHVDEARQSSMRPGRRASSRWPISGSARSEALEDG